MLPISNNVLIFSHASRTHFSSSFIISSTQYQTSLGQVLDIVHAPRRIIAVTPRTTGTILEPGKISVMLEYSNAVTSVIHLG